MNGRNALSALVLGLCLQVCGATAERIEVQDDVGNTVSLDAPAQRIVSLSPHLTEILFSIGVGDRIVATVQHADFPPEAASIPVLGDAFSIGVEAVVALSPDLILAWTTGGSQRSLTQLAELGFPIFLNEATRLDDIGETVIRVAQLVGQAEAGDTLARNYRRELDRVRAQGLQANKPKVFFQISDSRLYTVNNEHLIGQAIALCGGENIFDDIRVMVPMVSKESVVAADPELIIISSPYPGFVSTWIGEWQRLGWSDRIRTIDASLITRPSLRMSRGIVSMCELLGR